MAETKKTRTIEECIEEVDEIIESLESGEIPLEDSFKIYEKGVKLIAQINSRIDKVEKKMIVLQSEGSPEEET